MTPTRTWVVIADGARAHILLHDKAGDGLKSVENSDFRAQHLPDREINADKPGRSFDSTGQHRHAMEPPTDPHREAKADFARHLAAFLDDALSENRFDRLVIAAAPVTLGDLRNALSDQVKTRLHAELDKDLTKIPTDKLPDHFADVLPV